MRRALLSLLLFSVLASYSLAQESGKTSGNNSASLPQFITSGLDAYKAKGPDEAVKAWIAKSPIDGSTAALTQANNLRQIQDFYGTYQGFEFVSSRSISPSTKVFYLALKFDKGPLFAKFVGYDSSNGWILTSFDFNTKEENIFPRQ